jgi:hypothetical protein
MQAEVCFLVRLDAVLDHRGSHRLLEHLLRVMPGEEGATSDWRKEEGVAEMGVQGVSQGSVCHGALQESTVNVSVKVSRGDLAAGWPGMGRLRLRLIPLSNRDPHIST